MKQQIWAMAFTVLFQLTSAGPLAEKTGNQIQKEEVEDISGFVLFRVTPTGRFEFLLLEKASEPGDWSPPKGHIEQGETAVEGATREMKEETTLLPEHYAPMLQYEHYFEYKTKKDVLKRVTLWPAQLTDLDHPIVISDESRDYTWAETGRALDMMKKQYKQGFFRLIQSMDCHYNLALC